MVDDIAVSRQGGTLPPWWMTKPSKAYITMMAARGLSLRHSLERPACRCRAVGEGTSGALTSCPDMPPSLPHPPPMYATRVSAFHFDGLQHPLPVGLLVHPAAQEQRQQQ